MDIRSPVYRRVVPYDAQMQMGNLDVKEQIEAAYRNRGGVITTSSELGRNDQRGIKPADFIYRGNLLPFRSKSDRFHIGGFRVAWRPANGIVINTSVMRECCRNVLFTPMSLSIEEVREGLDALRRTRITRAGVRELIASQLPDYISPALQGVCGDLFEVVDVLTAIARGDVENYLALGLFAGGILYAASSKQLHHIL